MNEVFKKARELGDALMSSEEYTALKQAEAAVARNDNAAYTLQRYFELKGELEHMMNAHEEDWAKLKALSEETDELKRELNTITEVVNLMSARETFGNMVNQVNSVLRFMMTGSMSADEDDNESGCKGSCEGCGGCRIIH